MSTKPILIKNGTVVNASSTDLNDVLIANGKVVDVGRDIKPSFECDLIDAKGKYVIPGGIDTNTRLEVNCNGLKPKDDFYHGTRAGVSGGTTMIIDLVVPQKGESPLGAYLDWRNKADKKAVCDYALHVALTWWGPQVAQDMETLVSQYGVASFKMFMAGEYMMNDSELYNAFKKCVLLNALPMVQAENGLIIKENVADLLMRGITGPEGHGLSRSENIEAEATNRACVIAENVGSSLYISPVMSESAAAMLALWRNAGNTRVFGEAIAAGLGTTFSHQGDFDKAAAMISNPPIRSSSSTPRSLMMRLAAGDLSTVGSANCTFDKAQKEVGKGNFTLIPEGVNGLEDRMSIVWNFGVETGVLSAQQFVSITSANAAKIFNIFPRKGCIAPGSDADVVVWDSRLERVISSISHHHNNDMNIFEGVKVKGNPSHVLVKGRICYANEELSTLKGWGHFVSLHGSEPVEIKRDTPPAQMGIQAESSQSPCDAVNFASGDCTGGETVTEFIEPKSLNFHEKKCAIEAMKKICSRVNLTLSATFKNLDKGDTNEISKANFQIIVSKVCGLSALSNREFDAIVRGYGNGDSVRYVDFLRACEYLYSSMRGR